MTEIDRPIVTNPEAIGDPEQTPIVQLPPAMAAYFERTRCPECRQINHTHADGCARATTESETSMTDRKVEKTHMSWCPFDGRIHDPEHVCWREAADRWSRLPRQVNDHRRPR